MKAGMAHPGPRSMWGKLTPPITSMEEVKNALMTNTSTGRAGSSGGPPGGFTLAAPRFKEDLEALTLLTEGEHLTKRCVRKWKSLTAYY